MSFPVRLVESAGRGRELVATRDLEIGDVALRVAPIAAVPSDIFAKRVCSGCLQPGGELCPRCGTVCLCAQCGSDGQRAAQLHAAECAALQKLASADEGEGEKADSSTVRLLLRFCIAHSLAEAGELAPLREQPNVAAIRPHTHPMELRSDVAAGQWACDGCGSACECERYACTAGCDWDLCTACYELSTEAAATPTTPASPELSAPGEGGGEGGGRDAGGPERDMAAAVDTTGDDDDSAENTEDTEDDTDQAAQGGRAGAVTVEGGGGPAVPVARERAARPVPVCLGTARVEVAPSASR